MIAFYRFAALGALILTAAALSAAAPSSDLLARAEVEDGTTTVVGTVVGGGSSSRDQSATVYEFLGLKYAQAPIGPLRWSPPVDLNLSAAAVEEDVVRADSLGAGCPQFGGQIPFPNLTAEDCLFLNIWRPSIRPAAATRPSSPLLLPVLFWIHGGGRQRESQRETETERQRDRETERQRDRETERQRDRDRETERQRQRDLSIAGMYIRSRQNPHVPSVRRPIPTELRIQLLPDAEPEHLHIRVRQPIPPQHMPKRHVAERTLPRADGVQRGAFVHALGHVVRLGEASALEQVRYEYLVEHLVAPKTTIFSREES